MRKSFTFFKGGIVPEDEDLRYKMMDKMTNMDDTFEQLGMDAYNGDIHGFCYRYLMANKSQFID